MIEGSERHAIEAGNAAFRRDPEEAIISLENLMNTVLRQSIFCRPAAMMQVTQILRCGLPGQRRCLEQQQEDYQPEQTESARHNGSAGHVTKLRLRHEPEAKSFRSERYLSSQKRRPPGR